MTYRNSGDKSRNLLFIGPWTKERAHIIRIITGDFATPLAWNTLTEIVINATDFVTAIFGSITMGQIPVVHKSRSLLVVWIIPSVAPLEKHVADSAYYVAQ